VYFIYPETCGVRLEEMDSLFGDATTAMGTPSLRSETGSIHRASSPVPSLDLRGRPGPDNYPPMDIGSYDPPHVPTIDGKPQLRSESGSRGRVGEWLNRMVGRDRGSSSSRGPAYERLDQRDEQ
jgi:hypothetical protein